MVSAKHSAIEKLSLYFFLSVLDEDKAQDGISKTWKSLNTKTLNWKRPPKNWEQILVGKAEKIRHSMGRALTIRRSGILQRVFPQQKSIDWSDWFEFLKSGHPHEISAVVWVKILKFDEQTVANALRISPGTLRFRLNRGLLALGQILEGQGNA